MAFYNGVGNGLLVIEVVVKEAARYPYAIGNIANAGAGDALFLIQLIGGSNKGRTSLVVLHVVSVAAFSIRLLRVH